MIKYPIYNSEKDTPTICQQSLEKIIEVENLTSLRNRPGHDFSGRINNVEALGCLQSGSKPRANQIREPTTSQGLQRNAHSQEDSTCVLHPNAFHSTVECRKFLKMDVEERKSIGMKKELCFYCLKRHLGRYCPNQLPCVKCQGSHSDFLHVHQNNEENVESQTQKSMVYKPSRPPKTSCMNNKWTWLVDKSLHLTVRSRSCVVGCTFAQIICITVKNPAMIRQW